MSLDEVNRLQGGSAETDDEFDGLADDDVVGLDDELDTDDDLAEELDDDEAAVAVAEEPAALVEEDDGEQASLDELLDQRLASRRGSDDADDDEDITALSSLAATSDTGVVVKVTPIKDRQEFVCNRCHLVKAKVQLADPARGLCRDCV